MAKFSKLWNNHYNDAHFYVMGHQDFPNAHKIGISKTQQDVQKILTKKLF